MNESKSSLRIVQFNLENLFVFMDHYDKQNLRQIPEKQWQKLSTSTNPNKPIRKLWQIAEAIQDMDADIYCLNEVGGKESLDNFNSHFLNDAYEVHLIEGNSDRGIDVGYLLKRGHNYTPELLTHKNRPLNFLYPHEESGPGGAPSRYFSRDVAELRLHSKDKSSIEMVLLTVHLKSKLDPENIDARGKLRREAELKTLIKIYNEIKANFGSPPIVVCGDFNGNVQKAYHDPEFSNLYEESDLSCPLEAHELAAEKRVSQVYVMGSKPHKIQIDYTLVGPELLNKVNKETSGTYYFKNDLGLDHSIPETLEERLRLPSDHYPMILDLDFK